MKTPSCAFAGLASIHFAGILSVAAIVYPFQVSLAQERDFSSERESLGKWVKMTEDRSAPKYVHTQPLPTVTLGMPKCIVTRKGMLLGI